MSKNYHTDNKAFVMYKEWEELFEALDKDEEVSQLIKALFAFAKRGEEAEFSGALKIAFITMRSAIERDGKKWEQKCDRNSENVRKRWNKNNTTEYERIQTNTNDTDKDKDKDKDKDNDNDNDNVNEAYESKSADSRIFISLLLNDGSKYEVTETEIEEWSELYPAVDVKQDLRMMKGWIDSNPSRRKTRTGIKRFITNWLAKTQNSGGNKLVTVSAMPDYSYGTEGVDYL